MGHAGDLRAVDFEQGLRRTEALVRARLESVKPGGTLYVAIHGQSHAGKTFFMAQLKKAFAKDDVELHAFAGSTRASDIEHIYQVERDLQETAVTTKRIVCFHVAWHRLSRSDGDPILLFRLENPHYLLPTLLERSVDVSVALFHPDRDGVIREDKPGPYDVLIENRDARVKR